MIRYVEEQNGIASVVHTDGSRTQFPYSSKEDLIGWDEEEICYATQLQEAKFFSAHGECLDTYRFSNRANLISFTCGTLLFEEDGVRYAYNRIDGQTRQANR
jgi:hypothetical protein